MASMRRLKRRLTVWQRYARRYDRPDLNSVARRPVKGQRGHSRAVMRLTDEQVRRDWFQFRPDGCWCAGCVGMGPCDDDAGHGDTWVDELADEDVADDDAGYPWPTGTIIEHAFAERGLL